MNRKKILFIILSALAVLISFYPVPYFVIDKFALLQTKDPALLKDIFWRICFFTHIGFGGLALLIGWTQFVPSWRVKFMNLHRILGKLYVLFVILSGISGLYIGYHATGGWVTASGFIMLGMIWLSTTINAFITIRNKDIITHQKMMIYSYAATFAAVTLRIWLPLLIISIGDFITAYKIVAWLSWVPNIFVAYFINKRNE